MVLQNAILLTIRQISLFLAIKAAHAIENTSEESDGNPHLVWKVCAWYFRSFVLVFDPTF